MLDSSKLSSLSTCKKLTSSLTPFLIHCKEIPNLLFRVIWACLATHTQNDSINLKKPLMSIYKQKKKLICHVFLEILQRYGKLVLDTLGMPCYQHPEILSTCTNLSCLSTCKISTSYPMLFWRYWKYMQTYFGFWVLWACLVIYTLPLEKTQLDVVRSLSNQVSPSASTRRAC